MYVLILSESHEHLISFIEKSNGSIGESLH